MISRPLLPILAALFVASGCSSGSSASPIPPMPSNPPAASAAPSAPASDSCDLNEVSGVDLLVSEQLDAFRARDFAAAFALASTQFQAISSVADLEALINDGRHAEVLDSVSHVVAECRLVGMDGVVATVTVKGRNGQTVALVYQLILEDGHWKILMSRPIGGHGDVLPSPAASLSA